MTKASLSLVELLLMYGFFADVDEREWEEKNLCVQLGYTGAVHSSLERQVLQNSNKLIEMEVAKKGVQPDVASTTV